MNLSPSYKIITPFASVYALCLFIPTIDALATVSYSAFGFPLKFSIAAFIFPAIFPLSDSITEVYGKKVSYYISIFCYFVIILFSLMNNFLLSQVDNKKLYEFIISPSLIITIVGPISYLVTSYININFIYKLKVLMRNSHFILRSLLCSAICGFVMSAIVQGALFYQLSFDAFVKALLSVFMIKMIVTLPYVYIAKLLVILYRYVDGIEIEGYNKNLVTLNSTNG